MENQPKTNALAQQSCGESKALSLKTTSNEGMKALAVEIYTRINSMKNYGREPESLDILTKTYAKDLEDYPIQQVLLAFKTHAKRNNEFPTVAELIGLIKRKGKPPLSREFYIAISKKDYENRTEKEKQFMRDFEAEQLEEVEGFTGIETKKQSDLIADNSRLRSELAKAKIEIKRLSDILHNERKQRGMEAEKPEVQSKIDKTIQHMRATGASEADIAAFQRGGVFA